MNQWLLVFLFVNFLYSGHALECYVCHNQEGNIEKCLNTIKTCEQGEDVCYSEIKWGSTPYWSQGAKKQFYVSKRCSTRRECERTRLNNMNDCSHIWYQDWKCSECCQGDRCNYFIISGAEEARISSTALILISFILPSAVLRIYT
ncbi:CD59 glycoprotein isoform X2 [Belonocnema kinseyi]|uniref:CD59 glycoprotein isoform X2 n=1 Tax=Belonocnema kinseyi TaxID=2817044 RepID=UPI00143D5E65|nr:CD59 glycoprotein isoform X2 [Belonocnema kinseyi]